MKKPVVDTPYKNSWADQEARRVRSPQSVNPFFVSQPRRDAETDRLMRAGIVRPEIQNAIRLYDVR